MPKNKLLAGSPEANINELIHSKVNISFSEIDFHAASADTKGIESYGELAGYLTGKYRDERSKVRSIYTWIANSISYDQEKYTTSGSVKSQSAEAVWQNRSAVCEGYTNLFIAMCNATGIESRMVKGYVRDYAGDELIFPNHAWNSVKINGKWHLLDVTWASIHNKSNVVSNKELSALYQQHKLDYFFLVDPQKMMLTHLPEDPYWQLQNSHIDLETFVKGEDSVLEALKNPAFASERNFEALIAKYEKLDSLERTIAYLERMETSIHNKVREYGLGIAYYYKAQSILKNADKKNIFAFQRAKDKARTYYQKSLEHLSELKEDDFGYDFSQNLADNVAFRMEVLQ